MRRLRAGLVTPLPGGLGNRSGGTRTPPRGARWTGTVPHGFGRAKARQADEANWRWDPSEETGRKPGNADPGIRNRRRGAPRGARVLQKGTRQDGRLVRRSVLHSLGLGPGEKEGPANGAGTTAYPGPQRIRAMTRASSSFRGASIASEPGIQRCRHSVSLWIPGPAQTRRPGMTKWDGCLKI